MQDLTCMAFMNTASSRSPPHSRITNEVMVSILVSRTLPFSTRDAICPEVQSQMQKTTSPLHAHPLEPACSIPCF